LPANHGEYAYRLRGGWASAHVLAFENVQGFLIELCGACIENLLIARVLALFFDSG
jgi:hypothetical protein